MEIKSKNEFDYLLLISFFFLSRLERTNYDCKEVFMTNCGITRVTLSLPFLVMYTRILNFFLS